MLPGSASTKENHTWIIKEKTQEIVEKLEMVELVKEIQQNDLDRDESEPSDKEGNHQLLER